MTPRPHPRRGVFVCADRAPAPAPAAVQAPVGRGTLYLFGPEILFRAQPHGTFKLFFNALAASAATDAVRCGRLKGSEKRTAKSEKSGPEQPGV